MVAPRKMEELEKEIRNLRSLVVFREDALLEKKLVSLRGMGKLLVPERELDQSISQARKSLFKGGENVIRR